MRPAGAVLLGVMLGVVAHPAAGWIEKVGTTEPLVYAEELRSPALIANGSLKDYALPAYQRPLSMLPGGVNAKASAVAGWAPLPLPPPPPPPVPTALGTARRHPPRAAPPPSRAQPPPDAKDALTRLMAHTHTLEERALQRGLGGQLDTHRLEQALRKLLAGEVVRVVYLGGSVTAGHDLPHHSEAKSWAEHVHAWLQTLAPDPDKARRGRGKGGQCVCVVGAAGQPGPGGGRRLTPTPCCCCAAGGVHEPRGGGHHRCVHCCLPRHVGAERRGHHLFGGGSCTGGRQCIGPRARLPRTLGATEHTAPPPLPPHRPHHTPAHLCPHLSLTSTSS